MKKFRFFLVAVLIAIMATCFIACKDVKFDISFEVDGEVYYIISSAGEEEIEMPPNPEKENYVFEGWYWDKDVWQNPFTVGLNSKRI